MLMFLFATAKCIGVLPVLSFWLAAAPYFRRSLALFTLLLKTAKWRGLAWSN
jgi:hypothetical protein